MNERCDEQKKPPKQTRCISIVASISQSMQFSMTGTVHDAVIVVIFNLDMI